MTCRRAAELLSRELDLELPIHQRAGLAFHTSLCTACRRFRRQLGAIDAAVAEFLATAGTDDGDTPLPPASKERLNAVMIGQLDGET